jgi:hypothetical protein
VSSASTSITTSSINTSSLTGGAKTSTTKTSSSQATSASNAAGSGSVSTGVATTGNGTGNVVQNIAPQLVGSYMPTFYQQTSYVPFEDMQLVQRGPTMAYYYDQTAPATSLAGVRSDGTTPNLAYPTMSADGRFARTDNSSPVQSQQTGSAGQTMMNATMMNPQYAYFYGANVMPGSFQQFPPIYSAVSFKLRLPFNFNF